LFGLLGTVLGMLLTFKAIGVGGSSASEVVAKGISEALVATQSGLMVALPGWMAAFLAKRWRTEYAAFLARLESITLRYFRAEFAGMTRLVARRAAARTGAGDGRGLWPGKPAARNGESTVAEALKEAAAT
jgi:hypothetical protein